MRDFLRELFALPTYKIWNIFLLILLALLSNLLIDNFFSFELSEISNDFYRINTYIYVGLSILCMVILLCNKFRGRHCWYFLGFCFFDFIMICAQYDTTPKHSIYWLGEFVNYSFYVLIIVGLINLRKLRLNIKQSRWALATRILFLLYLSHAAGAVSTFYLLSTH